MIIIYDDGTDDGSLYLENYAQFNTKKARYNGPLQVILPSRLYDINHYHETIVKLEEIPVSYNVTVVRNGYTYWDGCLYIMLSDNFYWNNHHRIAPIYASAIQRIWSEKDI